MPTGQSVSLRMIERSSDLKATLLCVGAKAALCLREWLACEFLSKPRRRSGELAFAAIFCRTARRPGAQHQLNP
jgi:hypothetical protein